MLLDRLAARIALVGADPRDDEDLRARKALLVLISVLILPIAALWGALYLAFRSPVGIVPIVYLAILLGAILMFARSGNFARLLRVSQVDILLAPTLSMIPLGGFLAGVGGYVLARRALAPIDHLAGEARRITADRLHQRLSVPNAHDEIGRLAAVINDTFARLESSFDQLRRFTADASHELRTPLSVIRGMHRRRFLVRANRGVDVSAFLAAWAGRVKLHSAVRVQIDVDPYSFL